MYFSHFLIIVPSISVLENTLIDIANMRKSKIIPKFLDNLNERYRSVYNNPIILHSSMIAINYNMKNFLSLITSLFFYFNIIKYIENIFIPNIYICDAPRPWGIYFQDSATPQMEGILELHDNILFYLVIILFAVG